MPTFEEYEAAFKMRDTVDRLITTVMERERPRYRYATVASIDQENGLCTVQFPEGGDPIPVELHAVRPQSVGQLVQIDGLRGDRYVSHVFGPAHVEGWTWDSNDRLWPFMLRGGETENLWPVNLIPYSSATSMFFGGYDQSSGSNGAWKEERNFMRRGYWGFSAYVLKGPNCGMLQFSIDGVDVGQLRDMYSASYIGANQTHGWFIRNEVDGIKSMRLTVNGKNASSSNYFALVAAMQGIRLFDLDLI